jgi:hypothetical protein
VESRSACGAIEIGSALIDFYLLSQAFMPEKRFMRFGLTPLSPVIASQCAHWRGNPYPQRPVTISEILSASGGRIATPVLRHWFAMTESGNLQLVQIP